MRSPEQDRVPADIIRAPRRSEERAALTTPISLRLETGETLSATLTDLTTRGCRLEVGRPLPREIHVTIVACSTMVGGRIIWSDGDTAGIEFGARLLPKTVRLLSA